MLHAFFLSNTAFPRRIVTHAGAVEIGDEVLFEIVGHGFQYRAADRKIMALAGGPLMLA